MQAKNFSKKLGLKIKSKKLGLKLDLKLGLKWGLKIRSKLGLKLSLKFLSEKLGLKLSIINYKNIILGFWSGCRELQKKCVVKELHPIFVISYNHTALYL